MNPFDYAVIIAYLGGMLVLGFIFRHQRGERDYFLADGRLGWPALALSAMATQLGAISFVSAPAFVGLREGGGMVWLAYEFGVPLGIALVLATVAPALYRSGVVTIYEFIERRFGLGTRLALSSTFQLSRGLATAVTIYAVAVILKAGFGVPFWQSLIIVGAGTALYSIMGGMRAVVIGDAIQMTIIVTAILTCLAFGLAALGGWSVLLDAVDPTRLTVLRTGSLGFSGDEFGLWPMIFGGIVLYASYYGCDQTQAQRLLAAKDYRAGRRVLLANGLLRGPITLTYCLMGLVVGALAMRHPGFGAQVSASEPDRLIPLFILTYLPHGLIGFVFVGILAAAMSSLSSAINSLAAVSVEDWCRLRGRPQEPGRTLVWARWAAIGWGAFTLAFSGLVARIAPTVIEAINKIGSLFYGPILAVFLLAVVSPRAGGRAAIAGLLGGLAVNLGLWLFFPQVFWFWWNAVGCLVALGIGGAVSRLAPAPRSMPDAASQAAWRELCAPTGWALYAVFLALLATGAAFGHLKG
ncbi:MAG: sodium:solute symporter [Rhodothalassiaceae bacterium]|nr:MAG: sodium:solute symporter [Rhodothalassiaceae bacterium]